MVRLKEYLTMMVHLKAHQKASMTEVKMVDQMVRLMEYLMASMTEVKMVD
jgi:hypothetical protein